MDQPPIWSRNADPIQKSPLLRNVNICTHDNSNTHPLRSRRVVIGIMIFLIIFSLVLTISRIQSSTQDDSFATLFRPSLSAKTKRNSLETSNARLLAKARAPLSCLIIVRGLDGGLGNRMFLFASGYGLARLHQCRLYVSPYVLAELRLVFVVNMTLTPVNLIDSTAEFENRTDIFKRYSACTLFEDLLRVPLNPNYTRYEMIGFYQAYGYFDRYRDEIAQLFEFNRPTIKVVASLVDILIKAIWNVSPTVFGIKNGNITFAELKAAFINPPPPLTPITWVGIHIRRKDFLTFFKIDTSDSYLLPAVDYYRRKYVNCRFLVASDDKDYAKEHLGNFSDMIITPPTFSANDDLGVLSLCEHSIVTAGTYGWWAGWLAGGNVLHDLNYPVPFQRCVREHYFPPWFLFPHNSSSKVWQEAKISSF